MGGQTALNLAIDCENAGIWKKFGVRMIGVDIEAIDTAENREKFKALMEKIGVGVCIGDTATSFLQGKEIAQEIGFPLIIRASYTLGGAGGAFVEKRKILKKLLMAGLQASPARSTDRTKYFGLEGI
jgi:carbamoyl-phosphate synthase large subunit